MTLAAWTSTNTAVADRLTLSNADSFISQMALLDPNDPADQTAAQTLLNEVGPARVRSRRWTLEQEAMRWAVAQFTGSNVLLEIMTSLQIELNSDDAKRHGVERKLLDFPPPSPSSREQLFALNQAGDVAGKPDLTWVGLSDVGALVEGDASTFATPGTVVTISGTTARTYTNLILRCAFVITTTGTVTFDNCKFVAYNRTWTGETAMVVVNQLAGGSTAASGNRNVFFTDCEFNPDFPDMRINSITGNNFTVKRCYIHRTTDGIGCQKSANNAASHATNPGTEVAINVRIFASIIKDLSYWTPDALGRPNSHNDCIQVFEGFSVEIVGCLLWDNVSLDSGTPNDAGQYGRGSTGSVGNGSYPAANGQCVALTPTKGHAITNVTIKWNYMNYGEAGISITDNGEVTTARNMGHIITGNRFGTNQGNVNYGKDIFIAIESITWIIPGFTVTTNGYYTDTVNGNTIEATGLPIEYQVRDF